MSTNEQTMVAQPPQPFVSYVTNEVFKITMENLKETLGRIETNQIESVKFNDKKYVTKDEFKPVRIIAYSVMSLIGSSFFIAMAALVYGGLHK